MKVEGFSTAPAATVLELNYLPTTDTATTVGFLANKTKTVTKSTNVNKCVLSNSTTDTAAVLATQLGMSGVMTKCHSSPALLKLAGGQTISTLRTSAGTIQKTSGTMALVGGVQASPSGVKVAASGSNKAASNQKRYVSILVI